MSGDVFTTSCEGCGWIGRSDDCATERESSFHTNEELACPSCGTIIAGEVYDWHLDAAMPLDVPADILKRLRRNGRAHATRARGINADRVEKNKLVEDPRFLLPMIRIEDFDPIDVYIEHNWTCLLCFQRVDIYKKGREPKSCVFGHINNMANNGGHVPSNSGPYHYECNELFNNKVETPREGKVDRLRKAQGILDGDKVAKTYPGQKIKGRSNWPPKGARKIVGRVKMGGRKK